MNILMILSHCDDEIIFGWPVIQKYKNISLLTLCKNSKYPNAENALREVCKVNNIWLIDFPRQETNFYRLPPRYEKIVLPNVLTDLEYNIAKAIELTKPDFIYTHNPMGEYGHGDHRATFNLVSMFPNSLLLSDVCFSNRCHLSSDRIPEIYSKYLYTLPFAEHAVLDMNWYNEMKGIYEKYKAWSWGGHEAIKECNIYEFR